MPSTYLDVLQYTRGPHGIAGLSAYYANVFRLPSIQAANVLRMTVPSTAITSQLNPYDTLSLFDGLNSEVVQVAQVTPPGATSIQLVNPTQFLHSAGVLCCSDGTQGSLAQQIFTASQWVEDICYQSLWVSTYSGEILSMPTMRAAIDEQGILWFRPRHFPITALSSITLQTTNLTTMSFDPTQAIIDGDRQLVQIPNLQGLTGSGTPSQFALQQGPPISRSTKATLTITYNSGYNPLPSTVIRAASLLVNQCFVQLTNSIGADQAQEGKRNITFTLRGDQSGESLLVKEAVRLLTPYIVEAA